MRSWRQETHAPKHENPINGPPFPVSRKPREERRRLWAIRLPSELWKLRPFFPGRWPFTSVEISWLQLFSTLTSMRARKGRAQHRSIIMGLCRRRVILLLLLLLVLLCFVFSVQGRRMNERVESVTGVSAAAGSDGGPTGTASSGDALFRSSVRKVPNASDPLHNR